MSGRGVNVSLACWPGLRHQAALCELFELSSTGQLQEPLWGALQIEHVQLVPQNTGVLHIETCQELARWRTQTQLRLHANVRVLLKQPAVPELGDLTTLPEFWAQAARCSAALGASVYSAHACARHMAPSLQAVFEHARSLEQLFGHTVAIEGSYPTRRGPGHWIASWAEYGALLDSGLSYALDLSHLNIVATQSGHVDWGLVQEMLAAPQCVEIHVSDNDGSGDQHQVCDEAPWWTQRLEQCNPLAVVFTEGNHRIRGKRTLQP